MNDGNKPNTGSPNVPAGTGDDGNTPAPTATPQSKGGETAKDGEPTAPEGYVLLKEEDHKNLVSQRDRNHNRANDSEEFLQEIAKERHIDGFLSENKEKYPDLQRADLMNVSDPDQLEAEADRLQRRFQDVAQNRLENVQRATPPQVSAEDKAKELKKMRDNPNKDSFGRMVELQAAPQT